MTDDQRSQYSGAIVAFMLFVFGAIWRALMWLMALEKKVDGDSARIKRLEDAHEEQRTDHFETNQKLDRLLSLIDK